MLKDVRTRFFVSLSFSVALCLGQQPLEVGQGVNFYSLEKERALGRQLAEEVSRQLRPLDNSDVQAYVERLGKRISAELPGVDFDFVIGTTSNELGTRAAHEPAAFPGGYIFVSASLIRSARNEGEFAAMLAHSMAHIAARHATRQAARGQVANITSVPIIFVGGWGGYDSGLAIPLGLLATARAYELDADRIATVTLAKLGYPATALADYLEHAVAGRQLNAYSPLPATQNRVEAIRALPVESGQMAPITEEFSRIQSLVR